MRKVVCDRCGAEMADHDERSLLSLTKVNGKGYVGELPLDLCPSCDERLRRFLSGQELGAMNISEEVEAWKENQLM